MPDPSAKRFAEWHEGSASEELVDDFEWSFKQIEVSLLLKFMSREAWAEWLAAELKMEAADGRLYWQSLKNQEFVDPIVLTDTDIWDGWHRAAIAVTRGDKTISSVYGTKPASIP